MKPETELKHQELTGRIIRVFLDVHNELGAGFLDSVYVEALCVAFGQARPSFERKIPLAVRFRGNVIGHFRADLVVAGKVLIETKAVPAITQMHRAQVLNYLRATVLEIGLLLNFGPSPGIKRFISTIYEKLSELLPHMLLVGVRLAQGAIHSLLWPSAAQGILLLTPTEFRTLSLTCLGRPSRCRKHS